jgi:hypothetical protein
MPSLLDSSIYNALAKYRLLDKALAVCGITRSDVLVLRELKYQLESNKDRYQKPILDPATLKYALDFYHGVGTKPPQPLQILPGNWVDSTDNKLLNTKQAATIWWSTKPVKVDGGEAEIFAATKNCPNLSIWTADLKCLVALAKRPECAHIHSRSVGKVYCLERILRELIKAHGFATVSTQIVPGHPSIDRPLGLGAAECDAAFLAFEAEVQKESNGLLVA